MKIIIKKLIKIIIVKMIKKYKRIENKFYSKTDKWDNSTFYGYYFFYTLIFVALSCMFLPIFLSAVGLIR